MGNCLFYPVFDPEDRVRPPMFGRPSSVGA
jgi:hypothetical protein